MPRPPTQSRVLATLERRERFSVALLLATNDCGGGWEGQLRAAYFPRLVGLALDNCAKYNRPAATAVVCAARPNTYLECATAAPFREDAASIFTARLVP